MYKHFIYIIFIIYFFASCNNNMKDKANNIIINLSSEPLTIDPTLNTDNWAGTYITHIFEGLTQKDKDNNIIPGVAERWEVSEDGLTYTFYLRTNAKWSDGKTVTANDFVYSWKRIVNPNTAAKFSYFMEPIKNAKDIIAGNKDVNELGIKSINDFIFEVTLEYPTLYFLELTCFRIAMPLRKDIIEKYNDTWTLYPETYIGNGAFKMVERSIDEKIVLIKNTNYWNIDNIKPNSLTFLMLEDPSLALSGIKNNSIHLSKSVPRKDVPRLTKENIIQTKNISGTYHIHFNMNNKIFENKNIRKALSLALDRNYIVSNITMAGEIPADALVSYGIKDYTGEFRSNGNKYLDLNSTNYINNIAIAKELLKNEGYINGKGFPVLEMTITTRDFDINVSEAIQSMLKENLGIDIRINRYDWASYSQLIYGKNFGDLALYMWYADFNDPINFLNTFRIGSPNNYGNYSNMEYEHYLELATTNNNNKNRMELMHKAEDILMYDFAMIPIYFNSEAFLVSEKLKDVEYDNMGILRFFNSYLVN
ncbi:peptide ABC transporter substrate-binding protein [Brachyspira pulli]|uniref:peptide ABC transporter substrate-binding protein n=1 Tax=Brachyspira pulli TaxID=310721 RepID=UPI0030043C5E